MRGWTRPHNPLNTPAADEADRADVGGEAAANRQNPHHGPETGPVPVQQELDMAKKITGFLKLQVPAGAANPSPPIGPALGQRGLNIMEFCKAFNAQTQKIEKSMPIPVVITAYEDRSFTFEMSTPPMSHYLKKAANLTERVQDAGSRPCRFGDQGPGPGDCEQKMKDLNCGRSRRPCAWSKAPPAPWASRCRGNGMAKHGKRTQEPRRYRRDKVYSL